MTYQRSTTLRWCLPLPGLALVIALAVAAPAPVRPPVKGWPKTAPADRARSVNNLKQIGLAFHHYHDTFNGLPGAAICGKDGRPLLSWRVAILPYIEAGALYKQFRFDEAWDGPNNKKLLARMPAIYGLPGVKFQEPHSTFYRVFTGPQTPFNPANARPGPFPIGLRLTHFTDGTSNTLLVVEAGEAVPWTKPDELAFDLGKPLPKLGGLFPEGFHVVMADGTVKFLDRKIAGPTLKAMITPAGGEVIDWERVPLARPPAAQKR
jgi:hypothetical protein